MASRLTTLIVVSIVVGTFIAGIITRAQREEQGPVDLIVFNGKVYAGDGKTFAEAVAVRGNTIVLVGSNREIKRLRRPQTTVVDAHGGTVLPGFNDSHVHFLEGSLALADVDLAGVVSPEELQEKIRAYAGRHGDKAWIVGHGWDPATFSGKAPTRQELDSVVPDRPVYLTSADGRAAWANTAALKRAGISRAASGPRSGGIVRNAAGEPTGVVKESAMSLIARVLPSPAHSETAAALRAGIDEAHRLGITSVQTAGAQASDLAVWDDFRDARALTLRAYHSLALPPGATVADVDKLEEVRRQYGDDPLLKTGSVEIAADDVDDGLRQLITMLDRRGWQVWIRTTSQQGVRLALDAFEAASELNPVPRQERRHRIEHATSIEADDLDRFARLGVIATLLASHGTGSIEPAAAVLRPADVPTQGARVWPWKGIAGVGGRLAFGSDWPTSPLDPRLGLREAASQSSDGPDALPAAIDAYTSGAAYASFDEQRKGTLARGMLADIVVLSADIFTTPAERMLDVRVDVTIFDGQIVYSRLRASTD